jgi:F-type H+-transporting ATPase subunit delta
MNYSDKQLAESLYLATEDKSPKQVDGIVDHFLGWLKQQGSLSKLPNIMQRLQQVRREKEGIELVTVRTKTPLSPEVIKKIAHQYEQKLQKKIQIAEIVDTSILGGLKIQSSDTELDLTFNKQLAELQRHLSN